MSKDEFLGALKSNLHTLDKDDIEEILEDYKLLIEEQVLEGASEDEVISNLEAPRIIAEQYISELKGTNNEEENEKNNEPNNFQPIKEKRTLKKEENLMLFAVLQIVNIIGIFAVIIPVFSALAGIFVGGISVIIAGLTSVFAFGMFSFATAVSIVCLLLGLGFLMTNLGLSIGYWSFKLLKKYVCWNISLVR